MPAVRDFTMIFLQESEVQLSTKVSAAAPQSKQSAQTDMLAEGGSVGMKNCEGGLVGQQRTIAMAEGEQGKKGGPRSAKQTARASLPKAG